MGTMSLRRLRELELAPRIFYSDRFPNTVSRVSLELGFAPLDRELGKTLYETPTPRHINPLKFEQNLRRASELLEGCVSTRRIAQDLEASIVTFMNQVELFEALHSKAITEETDALRELAVAQMQARRAGLVMMRERAVETIESLKIALEGPLSGPATVKALETLLAAVDRDIATESTTAEIQAHVERLQQLNLTAL